MKFFLLASVGELHRGGPMGFHSKRSLIAIPELFPRHEAMETNLKRSERLWNMVCVVVTNINVQVTLLRCYFLPVWPWANHSPSQCSDALEESSRSVTSRGWGGSTPQHPAAWLWGPGPGPVGEQTREVIMVPAQSWHAGGLGSHSWTPNLGLGSLFNLRASASSSVKWRKITIPNSYI